MWFTVVLIIQIFVILAMIAAVLLQRSEGGALGMGGGGGGGGGLMSNRGVGSALTRATAILAGAFFVCSIALTILARGQIDDGLDFNAGGAATAPTQTKPALDIPAVPLGDDEPGGEVGKDTTETGTEDDGPQIPE